MPPNLQLPDTVHIIWCLYDSSGSWLTLSSPPLAAMRPPWERPLPRMWDMYIASVRDRLRSNLWEVQAQSTMEACQQKWYYDRKIGTVNLKPGNLVLVKADAWKGKRKIKDRWGRRDLGVGASNCSWHPLLQSDEPKRMVTSPPLKLSSSHHIRGWCSLVYGQLSYMGHVYQSQPMQDYLCQRWWKEDATREKW